jgi:hypothetical protein
MKICILTSYTDYIRWDNYGKCDYGDFSSLNHHEYSNKHGYSYIKEIVKNEDYIDWHPTWIKIDILKKYLPLYDYVVWVDSDAVFVNQDISIGNLIGDGIDLVIPKLELDRVSGNMWTHTTTGFMIWKNSDWSNNVLNLLWDEPKQFRFEFFHEQSRLDEILYENFKFVGGENILNKNNEDIETPITLGNIKILPYSYHRYWEDGDIKYVYHAGGNTGTKLERIKRILKKDE